MKLAFFDDYKLGVVKGDNIVDVSSAVRDIPHLGPHDLINGLIAKFGDYKKRLEDAAASGKGVPVSSVKLQAPLPKPGNIVCMAVNYMENGTRKEPAPINAFHKAPTSILGPGGTMVLPDVPATIFEGEAEMARGDRQARQQREGGRRHGLRVRLHQLHRRLGARPSAAELLCHEVARHLRADRSLSGDRRRDRRSAQGCRSSCGSTAR